MVGVGVGLEAVAHPGQGAPIHGGGGHDIGAKVDQQVVVDQRSGALPQARASEGARPLAVIALAEGLWKSVRRGAPW